MTLSGLMSSAAVLISLWSLWMQRKIRKRQDATAKHLEDFHGEIL